MTGKRWLAGSFLIGICSFALAVPAFGVDADPTPAPSPSASSTPVPEPTPTPPDTYPQFNLDYPAAA